MPRVVDHAQRRTDLVRAAVELVRDRGVGALSVRNLAAASGWSAGAVRHYFPSQQELIEAVVRYVRDGFEARLLAVAPDPDPLGHARALLRAGLPLDDESRVLSQVWFAFLAAEAHRPGGAGELVYDELAAALEGMFVLLPRERLAVATPRQAALTLQAALDGLTVHLLLGRVTPAEATEAIDHVLAGLVRGAGPGGAR